MLRFTYRNMQGTSVLSNPGFESGDLGGWISVADYAGTAYAVVRGNSPPGSYTHVFGTRPVYLGPAAGGNYFLEVTGLQEDYGLTLYQDVPTVLGGSYLVRVFFRFFVPDLNPWRPWTASVTRAGGPAGTGRAGTDETAASVAGPYMSVSIIYRLGTPANPTLYGQGSLQRAEVLPSGWMRSTDLTFTATATTTRMTLRAEGHFLKMTPLPVAFDEVQLEQTALLPSSQVGLRLGTLADAGLIASEDYGLNYAWLPTQVTFKVPPGVESIRLAFLSTYAGGAPLASFLDQVSLRLASAPFGLGGENPVDAIRYMLETFLPDAVYDADNFAYAAQVLMGWKFGAVLTNPGDSRALLQRMAYQCGSILFQDGLGRFKITVLNASRIVQLGFNVTNIVEGSCSIGFEPIDNLYSDLYVWFAAKTGGSTSSADFQGVVYATPTGTTAVSVPLLVTQCGAARTLYGREHRLDYYADFIQDVGTAHLLLTWLVSRLTIRHTLVTFRTWLDGVVLEIGDLIQVTHPLVGNGVDPMVCEVVSQQTDFARMQVELVARTIELAGWSADFDYTLLLLQDAGWFAPFEYTVTPAPEGEGWSAEFEDV
jgi:hypothetical protein